MTYDELKHTFGDSLTYDELKRIFGDSVQEVTIPANIYGIDINVDFNNYAVYYNAEFTKSTLVKAHICEFKQVKKHGVVPNNSNCKTFNCYVGDYYVDEAIVILKDLQYGDFDFMSKSAGFGNYEAYSVTAVTKDNLNKFLPYRISQSSVYGWYGFFTSLDVAKGLIEDTKQKEISNLKSKIKTIEMFSLLL